MFDELIQSLRQCAEGSCAGCKNDLVQIGCRGLLQHEAADAIEKMSEAYDKLSRHMDDMAALIPRWIPVTEKENLPNTDSGVVGYFGGGAFDQLRWYDFVCTLTDGSIVSESSERDVMNEHCIAVYKLPEPPKEET